MRRLSTISAFVVVVCFAFGSPANAGSHGDESTNQLRPNAPGDTPPNQGVQRLLELKRGLPTTQGKISSPLRSVLSKITTRGITRATARTMNAASLTNPLVRLKTDGRIQVYVHLKPFGEAQLNALRALEVEIEIGNQELAIVQGWVPFDRIEDIAALSYVTRVTAPSYGRPRAGSVTTEGDAIHKADQVRALGFDGTGVKVGIISDGANDWPQSQAIGDLPAGGITVFGNCTPSPRDITICSGGFTCNEGTAIAEIIYDMAPGAEIAVGAVDTSLDFIARIDDLANTFGADIIIDDLGFFGEPYFEDGSLAQAVDAVKNQVVFVSSAGNAAHKHYEDDYVDSFNVLNDHDFGGAAGGASDTTMDVLVGAGERLVALLEWNDQFGSATNDYNLFILDDFGNNLCNTTFCFGETDQNIFPDPLEGVCFFNNSPFNTRVNVVVERISGVGKRLELFLLGLVQMLEYNNPDGSIFGHPAVPGVLATGAIRASDPGNDDIEFFSSLGPSRIYFPNLQIREKPDVAAIDGVSVTGTGGFSSTYFGTSASAPHVAAVAALLKHSTPSATPEQIRNALTSAAVDLGPAGRDDTYGWGRVDALAALGILRPTSLPWLMLLLND